MNRESRGVSPVVAVILMVAITVVLSAAVGAFVFDLGQSTSNPQESLGVRFSDTDIGTTVQFVTGTEKTVKVTYRGRTVQKLSGVSAGDQVIVPASPGGRVSIIADSSVVTTQTIGETPALVGYWTMDDEDTSNGKLMDDSQNGHEGVITGGVNTSVTPAPYNEAYEFNGADGFINTTVSYDFGTFTVCGWMYRTDNSSWHALSSQQSSGTNDRLWWFGGYKNQNRIHFSIHTKDGASPDLNSQSNTFPQNTWVHSCGSYSDGSMRVYLNGTLNNESQFSSEIIESNGNMTIGAGLEGDRYHFAGNLDDHRVYSRALSKAEVEAVYNATK